MDTAELLITKLMKEKAKGDPAIEKGLRVKLMLKGINVNNLDDSDPVVIEKIKTVMTEFGVAV